MNKISCRSITNPECSYKFAFMQRIAFFDFDGTITTRDTFLEMIKFRKGKFWFYAGMIINTPALVAYKLGIISNQQAKQQVMRFFFGGETTTAFRENCDRFAIAVLPGMIRPKAQKEIANLLEKGTEVVIVSASAESWIKKWTDKYGLQLIATLLEESDGCITGKISGKNCHGEEKVSRIKARYNLAEFDEIYCYGDTAGDRPMLALGKISFYKPFR